MHWEAMSGGNVAIEKGNHGLQLEQNGGLFLSMNRTPATVFRTV